MVFDTFAFFQLLLERGGIPVRSFFGIDTTPASSHLDFGTYNKFIYLFISYFHFFKDIFAGTKKSSSTRLKYNSSNFIEALRRYWAKGVSKYQYCHDGIVR